MRICGSWIVWQPQMLLPTKLVNTNLAGSSTRSHQTLLLDVGMRRLFADPRHASAQQKPAAVGVDVREPRLSAPQRGSEAIKPPDKDRVRSQLRGHAWLQVVRKGLELGNLRGRSPLHGRS